MPVPNTFANATTSIPLSQLDQNFATAITLGNTAIQLGNTVTTLNNMTLANVTVSTGNVSFTQGTIGGNVVINTTGTANTGNLAVTGTSSGSATNSIISIAGTTSSNYVGIKVGNGAQLIGRGTNIDTYWTSNNDLYTYTNTGAASYLSINGAALSWNVFGSGTGGAALGAATTVLTGSATGLAVTGTLSATGQFSASNAVLGIRNNITSTDRISVAGATTIFSIATGGSSVGASGAVILVNGYNTASSTNSFIDLVLFIGSNTPTVLGSVNRGSPAARTYTASGNNLQLAMASGTYNVSSSSTEQAC